MMPHASGLIRKMGPWGLYALAQFMCKKQPRVLMYHRFSEERRSGFTSATAFRQQLEYIVRHFQPMTLRDLVKKVHDEGEVPANAIVLTIDDGYRDFYDVAYPLLREFDVPATLFATTGFISGDSWLWPDQVRYLLDHTGDVESPVSIGTVTIDKGTLCTLTREDYWRQLVAFLLTAPDDEKHRWIDKLAGQLGTPLPEEAPEEYAPASWSQLRTMESAGIEIGGHTVTHPSLGQVTHEQAEAEIRDCMAALEDNLLPLSRTFCFPNGKPGDCPESVKQLIAKSRFVGAVVAFADAGGVADRYAMRRHSSGENYFQFLKAVSGVEYLGHKVKSLIVRD